MIQVTSQGRTVMYSRHDDGRVIRHELPWNANEPIGMTKCQKMVDRGFTFDDPVKQEVIRPEVITDRVSIDVEVPVVYTCIECGKVCRNAFGLRSHMKSHKNV